MPFRSFAKSLCIGAVLGAIWLLSSGGLGELPFRAPSAAPSPTILQVSTGVAESTAWQARSAACRPLIHRIGQLFYSRSEAKPPTGFLGDHASLRHLMIAAEVPPDRVDRYLHYLEKIGADARDPLLLEVVEAMRASGADANFFVCVAGSGCRLVDDHVAALYSPSVQRDFRIVSFADFESNVEALKKRGALGKEKGQAVLMSRPESDDPMALVNWVSAVLHEFTHYRDMKLIGEWMRANLALKKRGQETDLYFRSYVKWVGGKPYLSAEFLSFILESRAHYISNESAKLILPRSEHAGFERTRREKTFGYLRHVVGQDFLDGYGVEKGNVLEVWRPIATTMGATISRASAP